MKRLIKISFYLGLSLLSILIAPLTIFIFFYIKFKKFKILINHREMGFGHQLVEPAYGYYILKKYFKNKSLLFLRGKPVIKILNKVYKDKIIFIHFIFTYLFYPFVYFLEKSKKNIIDIGSSSRNFDLLLYNQPKDKNYLLKRKRVFLKRILFHKIFEKKDYIELKRNYNFPFDHMAKHINSFSQEFNIDFKKDWYVCLHVRNDQGYDEVRSANLENYYEVCNYINSIGGRIILLGKNKNNLQNKNIINLAEKNYNNVLMNLYLLKNCRIFISSCSGPSSIYSLFDTPQLNTNTAPFSAPAGYMSSYIPILIFDVLDNRILSLKETYNVFFENNHLLPKRYKIIKNSSSDILEAFKFKLKEVNSNNFFTHDQSHVLKSLHKYAYEKYLFSKIDPIFYEKNKNIII